MALYPRRVISSPTSVTVSVADGTSWYNPSYPPSVYKGSSNFTTLQSVYNSLGTAGGFAPLGLPSAPGLITSKPIVSTKGPIRSQMMTIGEYGAIGPAGGLLQGGIAYDNDAQTCVWESAAWNGYGWFWIPSGGHYAGYRNDMYLVRIADPMMCIRLYNTSPIAACSRRSDGIIVDPSTWNSYPSPQITAWPEWGPLGAHHYDGMQFDPATEKILWGGDTPLEILNPTQIGQGGQVRVVLSVFDTKAGTPKSAWQRLPPSGWVGSTSIYGMIDVGDGTYEFGGYLYGNPPNGSSLGTRYHYNPVTNTTNNTGPFHISGYVNFGHAVRDPATGKTYETRANAAPNQHYSNLVEIGGGVNVNIGLYEGDVYSDNGVEPIIINSKAYCFGIGAPAGAADATKTVPLAVSKINLATGVREQLITNGLNVPLVVGGGSACSLDNDVNGLHGRVGFVPSVGAFVILLSAIHDVYVFRPPASWGGL